MFSKFSFTGFSTFCTPFEKRQPLTNNSPNAVKPETEMSSQQIERNTSTNRSDLLVSSDVERDNIRENDETRVD